MSNDNSLVLAIKPSLESLDEEYKQILVRNNKEKLTKCLREIAAKTPLDQLAPPPNNIFAAFQRTPWNKLSVVLIGQDPYPTPGDAMGLCFSTRRDKPPPRSLKNIHSAVIASGFMTEAPTHGDLSSWADQGVLMLNLALTTQVSTKCSHIDIWEPYIESVLEGIAEKCATEGRILVFMLWGNVAARIISVVDRVNHRSITGETPRPVHRVLKWGHPSPISMYNTKNPEVEPRHFTNCDNFVNCNRILRENNRAEINFGLIL